MCIHVGVTNPCSVLESILFMHKAVFPGKNSQRVCDLQNQPHPNTLVSLDTGGQRLLAGSHTPWGAGGVTDTGELQGRGVRRGRVNNTETALCVTVTNATIHHLQQGHLHSQNNSQTLSSFTYFKDCNISVTSLSQAFNPVLRGPWI